MTGPDATLAGQAAALTAAAGFIEQAGMAGLTVAVTGGQITILVPRALAVAARIATVTALAGLIGAPAPACTTIGSSVTVSADGTIDGCPARIWASIEPQDSAA